MKVKEWKIYKPKEEEKKKKQKPNSREDNSRQMSI